MKKTLLFALALCAIIGPVWAYDFTAVAPTGQTLYYTILGYNEVAVTSPKGSSWAYPWNSYTQPSGSLTIPSSVTNGGNTYIVTEVDVSAFRACGQITSISIPPTVSYLNARAFEACWTLQNISIPNSVVYIGEYCFQDDLMVGSITVPNSVMYIGEYAFQNVDTVYYSGTAVGSPWGAGCVISIGYEENGIYYMDSTKTVLTGCADSLTSITLPQSVSRIMDMAFAGHTSLSSIVLNDSLEIIGNGAFWGCIGLSAISIPNAVTTLGEQVFAGCTALTSVTLPNNITAIGNQTFYDCLGLASISLPGSVISLGEQVFSGCAALTSISLPGNITAIGNRAFNNCTALSTITIPSNVIYLGESVFSGCNNITTVNYNAVDCRQGGGAFQGLARLTTLNIGTEVQYIPISMFKDCTGLVTLNIPDAVMEIGSEAFSGCINLTNANLGNGLTAVSSKCFYNCLRLTTVRLGDALTAIGQDAFFNCGIVGELVMPQGVITIGPRAFMQCYGINRITALGRVAPMLEYEYNGYNGEYSTIGPFYGVDSNIVVNVPCGTTNMYTGRWPQFHNFNEMPFMFNAISEDVNKGTVTVEEEPTCDNPYATIRATPKSGYHFDHWSDGSTSNPYSYTATGSVTLIGYFVSNEAIEEAWSEGMEISLSNGHMVVNGAEGKTVRVYNVMGHMLATAMNGESIALPGSGVYVVKVGETTVRKVVVIK